ncbi:hypothetical protein HRG_008435 [Hirsutella rhossiliensis]|uniref:Uncharacterized protein n=1 Tax=Hirsutella rhossiliensis TaxID=111463 RepID=A0A9P8MS51_9HYPO|nr:uncharacterized protein HRG_08435 [Hirsutella rhossiliensis]KAH0960280.1 hypothetical protein HRG_08435 [Hirsutella rhossiliensis]
MPSSAPLRAAEVAALDDEALDRYLDENRLPDGTRAVPVDDWENIPSHLLQRLRDRALGSGGATVSIDPDELTKRLLQASPATQSSPPGSWPVERSPTPLSLGPIYYETADYHELVAKGGQPLYPIHFIGEISRHPEQHLDLLRPWLECPNSKYPPNWTTIFNRQLDRWQNFRNWQLDNRGLTDPIDDYSYFIEMQAREYERDGEKNLLAELRADPESLRPEWQLTLRRRDRQRRTKREIRGHGSFPEYAEAAKRRLAHHGFTQPFELMADPTEQDRLTTWIEYLEFECWWHDLYVRSSERLQSISDAAWTKLVDSGVLRPSETAEYLRGDEARMARQREWERAEQALKEAKSSAEGPSIPGRGPKASPRKPLPIAPHKRLMAAEALLKSVRARNECILDFLGETWDYDDTKKKAECHRSLVQWVMDQVPLIEASQASDDAPRKRGRQDDEEEDGRLKRQRTEASAPRTNQEEKESDVSASR